MAEKLAKNYRFIITLNILGLAAITASLIVAFYYQLVHYELPCPLCLLQRIGLTIAGIGFLFNIYRTPRYSHYALIMVAALVTAAVATRQIFLHILPNDPGYGSTFLGLHFYSWVFITCVLLIVGVLAIIVLTEATSKWSKLPSLYFLKPVVTFLFIATLVGNIVSTFLECGFEECPADPIAYHWLK